MCDQQLWSQIVPFLLPEIELIHLSVPKLDSMPELIEQLISRLPDNEPVNLMGFSLGGYLAIALAARYPNKIHKLLSISNSPCSLPESELRQRKQTLAWLEKASYSGITDSKINSLLGSKWQGSESIFTLIKAMEQSLGYHTLKQQLSVTSNREDFTDFIKSAPFTMQFCYGDEDTLVNRQWMQEISTHSTATVSQIANSGHMLPLEQPEILALQIKSLFS